MAPARIAEPFLLVYVLVSANSRAETVEELEGRRKRVVVQVLDTLHVDVCRAIAELALKPKRTIRCVMFAAEELGGIGGGAYAEMARQRGDRHIMAIESDRGGFAPKSISIDGTDADVALANSWSGDFQDLGMTDFYQGGAGTDVEPLRGLGAITMELIPDSTHYFDYHHAATDRFEAVDRMDLAKGSAALAAIVWRYSELP
jgi:acetylornithine deacetylase/succinyl-diaminopimelate desuccinylase-like protein